MPFTTAQLTISLDGYLAGPDQSEENPLGVGGERLHAWMSTDAEVRERMLVGDGAYVMGRNMFGPVRGEWDREWRGWWGEDPPYHAPVYVLTHHAHDPIEMEGGTTFHFVTDGFDVAFARAREAAGDRKVAIAGGASTFDQALRAGVVDEFWIHVAPVVLGAGERLFEGVAGVELEPVEVVPTLAATHVRYRVVR